MGLSSVCPSSLCLASISHPAGIQVLEPSAPSRPFCQHQVTSSARQMLRALWAINPVSPGGSLSVWVVSHISTFFLSIFRLCCAEVVFLCEAKFLWYSFVVYHSLQLNASERAVKNKARSWASASFCNPLLGDADFYSPHSSFQSSLWTHCLPQVFKIQINLLNWFEVQPHIYGSMGTNLETD